MQLTCSESIVFFIVNYDSFCLVFIFLISLVYNQMIFSLKTTDNVENENRIDEFQQIPSSFESLREQTNIPQCLLKSPLSQVLNRNRRASISRPYFHHWRQTRDNRRYVAKNSLAFSPRLGKRTYINENELDNGDETLVYRSIDHDNFLVNFSAQLLEKQIDIVYEDSTKICLSQPINDAFIKQIFDEIDISRRNQDEQETRVRQTTGKHPVLFRYRLG
jgi:hypothetical protein